MTGDPRRRWLIGALLAAVVLLAGSVTAVAVTVGGGGRTGGSGTGTGHGPGMMGGSGTRGYGPGMMGGSGPQGYGPGMMGGTGYALAGDGKPVTSLAAAAARAQAFADQLGGGLHPGEVTQFSNGYYAELLGADGAGATEVLIDQGTGAVRLEPGPAMMWNTRYGMHPGGTTAAPQVSAEQAMQDAQRWLDAQRPGQTAGKPLAFPGYYTLDTLRGGTMVGMMSVNATTGAIWYHSWHGTFVATNGD